MLKMSPQGLDLGYLVEPYFVSVWLKNEADMKRVSTYKGPAYRFRLIQHFPTSIQHIADRTMIACALDGMFAYHVDHLLVTFD